MSLTSLGLYRGFPYYLPAIEGADFVNYGWDSESPFSVIPLPDFLTLSKLDLLSSRAITAYSVGCAEWIIFFLRNFIKNPDPVFYLEGFWAYVMGREDMFEYPPELDHDLWEGPELGPVDCAISSIMNVIYLSQFGDPPSGDAARIGEIARYILPEEMASVFSSWEQGLIERLIRSGKYADDDRVGRPIPRAILDVSWDSVSESWENAINLEFEGCDFSANPFFIR